MIPLNKHIETADKAICENISRHGSDRGFLSQNLLVHLRNFVEHIALKIHSPSIDIDDSYPNIKAAERYIKTRGDLRFLRRFHRMLQKSVSHYTNDEENSERLMLKYYEYLLKTKQYVNSQFGLNILRNLHEFPLKMDSAMDEYYQKIAQRIDYAETGTGDVRNSDRYYIQKIKPFFVENQVYYEVTVTTAIDNSSKFDRVIAFTNLDICPNYAAKLRLTDDVIEVFGKNMPIKIINDWEPSIRPCELAHFADIIGTRLPVNAGTVAYRNLMAYLKESGLTLVEIINLPDGHFSSFAEKVSEGAQSNQILAILRKCRELVLNKAAGHIVIQYLLHTLNNRIVKRQKSNEPCEKLSNLRLRLGCIPFDEMPFTTSLIYHNPKLGDLTDCFEPEERKHEFLARRIRNNTETKSTLYTPTSELNKFDDVDALIKTHNDRLYWRHGKRKLTKFRDRVFIEGYEADTLEIIRKLRGFAVTGVAGFSGSVDYWLNTSSYIIDCKEKKSKLRTMFENSKVTLVYGSAGTGKSTLINHVSNFFHDSSKLYLANTNPAIDNLRRKVISGNSTFSTVAKFLSDSDGPTEFDLLVVDECSTLSNADMLEILNRGKFEFLLLVGDVFQIESIRFGNWFSLAQQFLPGPSVIDLTTPYRTTEQKLLELWGKVRSRSEDILEHLTKNGYSIVLDESIFNQGEANEIILCLNYDGLYGINNINRFLQENNPNKPEIWGVQTYKINDPILFNESNRFAPLIYNNLKGRIVGLERFETRIQFDVEINKVINEYEAQGYDFELSESPNATCSIVRFSVNKLKSTDDDEDSSAAVVPFQVAYAVSIHKAQGLEYDSVKVVITDEIEELVSHNIFYTAITRARKKLKIYWTPETEKKILESFESDRVGRKDAGFLRSKFKL